MRDDQVITRQLLPADIGLLDWNQKSYLTTAKGYVAIYGLQTDPREKVDHVTIMARLIKRYQLDLTALRIPEGFTLRKRQMHDVFYNSRGYLSEALLLEPDELLEIKSDPGLLIILGFVAELMAANVA